LLSLARAASRGHAGEGPPREPPFGGRRSAEVAAIPAGPAGSVAVAAAESSRQTVGRNRSSSASATAIILGLSSSHTHDCQPGEHPKHSS
jgi:hypothetical protein